MLLKNFKKIIIFCCFITALLFLNCDNKSDLSNQITIKINSIDSKTKKARVNAFDSIDVRVKSFGFLMKRFVKVAECVTDSSGSVNIKVDYTKENHFILGGFGLHVYGATEFAEGSLKEGQEVTIEVIHSN